MNINELRGAPHLSASSIGDYIDCGMLFKFGRIDKVKREFIADSLEFGTAIHKVLGEYYMAKMQGKKATLKQLHDFFAFHWSHAALDNPDIKYADGKSYDSYLLQGKEMLSVFYEKLPDDNFKVLSIEEPFSFTIEGMDTPIIGATDLMEEDEAGTIIITDWKTAGKAYSSDEIDKSFQLTVYEMAARANGYKDCEILLRFDALIKTKTPKFEQYWTTRSDIDLQRARKKILQVNEGIAKGVFIPNDTGWKCGGCAFKNHCNNWFMEGKAA